VKICDLTVSSQHCKVMLDNGMPYVVDFTSSNGTFINHHPTRLPPGKLHYLVSGDRISLVGPYGKGAAPPLFSESNQVPRTGFEFIFTSTEPALIPESSAVVLSSKIPQLNEKYALVQELGKGTFATVYRAVSRTTGEHVAIKVIERSRFLNMSPHRWSEQCKEAETLRKLHHPGIVMFKDLIQNSERLFVVTELLRGGELYERLMYIFSPFFSFVANYPRVVNKSSCQLSTDLLVMQ